MFLLTEWRKFKGAKYIHEKKSEVLFKRGHLLFLQRTGVQVPAPTLVGSRLPVTLVSGDLMPSSGIRGHLHSCTHPHKPPPFSTHTHHKEKKKKIGLLVENLPSTRKTLSSIPTIPKRKYSFDYTFLYWRSLQLIASYWINCCFPSE